MMIRDSTNRLLAVSICNADTDELGITKEWNRVFPWYKESSPPSRLLGHIFYYTAERYIRAFEGYKADVNPFTALAWKTCDELKKQYWMVDKKLGEIYNLAVWVGLRLGSGARTSFLTIHAGRSLSQLQAAKRWISNGLSTLELWDIALSRHALSKDQILDLLRDDPQWFAIAKKPNVSKEIEKPEFLATISREANKFLLKAAAQFRLPIPSMFYERLFGVLKEVEMPADKIETLLANLKILLKKGEKVR